MFGSATHAYLPYSPGHRAVVKRGVKHRPRRPALYAD
ncbi:hypothetical protein [Pseudomonas phage PAShipCat1]|nr:MAG TPA_asm: hypothetical protein [Caudoviricetes sp.]